MLPVPPIPTEGPAPGRDQWGFFAFAQGLKSFYLISPFPIVKFFFQFFLLSTVGPWSSQGSVFRSWYAFDMPPTPTPPPMQGGKIFFLAHFFLYPPPPPTPSPSGSKGDTSHHLSWRCTVVLQELQDQHTQAPAPVVYALDRGLQTRWYRRVHTYTPIYIPPCA